MPRPKTSAKDLPPRMLRKTRLLASGRQWVGYYYQGRDDDGRRVQIPLGTDLAEAKRKWANLEAKPMPVEAGTMRLVFDRFIRDIIPQKAPRTQKDYLAYLRMLRPAFDPAPVAALTPQAVIAYRDRRAKTAPVRANREVTLLGYVYQYAREWGYTSRQNPCTGLHKLPERPRDYYLDDDVWQALHAAAVPELRDAFDLAYLTGQRPADVLRMRMTDVRDGALEVQQGKTRRKLRIRLNREDGGRTELGKLIDRLQDRDRDQGMGGNSGNLLQTAAGKPLSARWLRYWFELCRAQAAERARAARDGSLAERIASSQFRDIRPKAASEIASLEAASHLLGHTHEEITKKIYVRRGREVLPVK